MKIEKKTIGFCIAVLFMTLLSFRANANMDLRQIVEAHDAKPFECLSKKSLD